MITPEIKIKLLDLMVKIRTAEEKIVEVYGREQQMRTPTHLSIGQEAVAAALSLCLTSDDQVFVGHRCHAAYLGRGGHYQGFFDELCGRATGICEGRAGSAHLTDSSAGIFASPILSAMIPVAVGAAWSFKMDNNHKASVAVFGDAAIEEGVFAESVNFAVTNKLPILFLCENNLYSTHTPLSVRQPASKIYERIATPDLKAFAIDGNDACLLYEKIQSTLKEVHQNGPALIECLTYRVREHVGPLFDYDREYRTKEEVDEWTKRCPVKLLSDKLVNEKVLTSDQIAMMELQWKNKADQAYAAALKAPWPHPETLEEHVY